MRIGLRAHDFGKLPAEELSRRIAKQKLECIQLTVPETIEGFDDLRGRLSPGLAFSIGDSFRRQGIQVAVLSCYINLIHPDDAVRRAGIELFKEHLRFVRDFGCGVVATETGSRNPDWSFNRATTARNRFSSC